MSNHTTARISGRARRTGAGMASIVRALCGSPAGASRRGSTIVLVVSSLALFAMITVAYVGLGIGDRRTGAVTVASNQVDDVATKVRDYLVDVIGRDAVAVFVEKRDSQPGSAPVIVREAWDYPWTDPNRVSVPAPQQIAFDPAGTMTRTMVEAARGGAALRVFAGSDPWLASTEPMWLPDISSGTPMPSDPYYLDLTSWWQISNFAPDGRFVNLHALRGKQGAGGRWSGNFDAEPGVGTDPDGFTRMSEKLILLDKDGQSTSNTLHGDLADKNVPAHWTMFQQGAARPVGPGRDGGGLARVDDPGYAPYSWVDADGDGIYDSRWFELVDASKPGDVVSLLPRDNRWRWFVAARAIDLSSLVNINTATDVSAGGAPTAARPIGATPADIDALRLFTLEDVFARYAASEGYNFIHQPPPSSGTPLADYEGYSDTFADADRIGQKAYQAIRAGAERGVVPPGDEEYEYPPTQPTLASERQEHYARAGARPGSARWDRVGASGKFVSGAAFGIQDLVELLTYHGLNDPATISRLEQMAGGRETADPQFSPLRDNRPLEIERLADVGPNPASPAPDGLLDEQRLALAAADPRRRLTTISGATQRRSSPVPYQSPAEVPLAIASVHSDIAPARLDARSLLAFSAAAGDAAPLFQVYASALLPTAELAGAIAAGVDPWADPEYRTMFYGHDPLYALRAAAHLAVNRIDSWDAASEGASDKPTAVTLVINGDNPPAEGDPAFPWRQLNLEADTGAEMLPRGSAPVAVNIYGIEAQPFLVQAATFIMYTDKPWEEGSASSDSKGGDKEWTEPDPSPIPGTGTAIPQPATIHGNVSRENPDFIFQALAFQLNNPFDESLDLGAYHIEFAGREYDLEDENEDPIVLAPRQSVVVYVLSQTKAEIAERMRSAASAGDPTFFVEQVVDDWLEHQFRGGAAGEGLMRTVELSRDADPGMGTFNQVDLLSGAHGAPNPDHRSVLLWRTLDTAAGDQHDILVDRLRDPQMPDGRPTLDRRLPNRHNDIAGSLVSKPGDQDDEGFSMTMWGSIRRPEDPRASEGAAESLLPRGGLPAWCLESRFGSTPGGELNIAETDNFNPRSLSRGDFVSDPSGEPDPKFGPQGEQRLDSLVQRQTGDPTPGSDPQILVRGLRLEPWAKSTGTALLATQQRGQLPYWSSGAPGLDPELHVGPQRSEPLRIGDMLMAMAVGPIEDPQDPDFLVSGRAEDKWTTLSESLALALGYDEVFDDSSGEADPTILRLTTTGPTPQLWHKTDRGFLQLDNYTPFYDGDGDGVYDPTSASDVLRGDGIPMALSLLDAFRPSFGADDSEQFGSLTNATPGVININTASPAVLRTLGILSPTATEELGGLPGRNWLGASPHGSESDVAATLTAYRDKTMVFPRELPGPSTIPLSFMSTGTLGTASRGPADPQDIDGRAEHTGIVAVREQPGFRSLGEIMLARDLNYSGPQGLHDMDRFALTDAMNRVGVESFTYSDTSGQPQPDALARDYDEKLAIFNSVAGSISVRSDLYAVWFVLHGYQREDVEGLTDDDPLIPSVAKRFLIIVDRSNVTTEGERPRILHFQELPF